MEKAPYFIILLVAISASCCKQESDPLVNRALLMSNYDSIQKLNSVFSKSRELLYLERDSVSVKRMNIVVFDNEQYLNSFESDDGGIWIVLMFGNLYEGSHGLRIIKIK